MKLGLDPKRVVIVTDIGCQGLGDQYFATNAFHGLHGRSIAYATGIKLADPDLKVIVMMGDGGTGIGGAHLLNAARRNIGLTVLVFNNFNFGMTGGEHSVTTPPGGVTATTRAGNLERPLDVCATVAVNGAGFVWRGTAFDSDLADVIAEAVRSESFRPARHLGAVHGLLRAEQRVLPQIAGGHARQRWAWRPACCIVRTRPEYARALRGAEGQRSRGAEEKPLRPRAAAGSVHLDARPRVPVRDRRLGGRQGALDRHG